MGPVHLPPTVYQNMCLNTSGDSPLENSFHLNKTYTKAGQEDNLAWKDINGDAELFTQEDKGKRDHNFYLGCKSDKDFDLLS